MTRDLFAHPVDQARLDAFFSGLFAGGPLSQEAKEKLVVEFGMTMESVDALQQRYLDPQPPPAAACAHETVWDPETNRGRCRKCGMSL